MKKEIMYVEKTDMKGGISELTSKYINFKRNFFKLVIMKLVIVYSYLISKCQLIFFSWSLESIILL